jgi:rubredoxin
MHYSENETPEEKYKREKLAEIAEKKALEVFVTRATGKFECQACGYIYDEAIGNPKKGIAAGTLFENIDKYRCPSCGANKKYFIAQTETLSGFQQNLKFGLGGNSMTGEAKNGLIFGALGVCFALLMSGYLME